MAHDMNQGFRKSLRDMTREFRRSVRDAAYSARERALAQEGGDDPRLGMVAERLDHELASQKASIAKRFARFVAHDGGAEPSKSSAE
jgi:hypothetical protein